MQTLEQFKSSLPEDLTPEQRLEKIEEFAKTQEESYKNLQSKADKDQNFIKDVFEESRKVSADSNYIMELIEKKPEVAQEIVKNFGSWITIEDIKSWKVKLWWDLIDQRIQEHDRIKELQNGQSQFEKAVWFNEEELKVFRENLAKLSEGKKITTSEQKQLMTGIAFSMGKQFSTDKNQIMANNNIIPDGKWGWGSSWWDYKPHDPSNVDLLVKAWVVKVAPEKK